VDDSLDPVLIWLNRETINHPAHGCRFGGSRATDTSVHVSVHRYISNDYPSAVGIHLLVLKVWSYRRRQSESLELDFISLRHLAAHLRGISANVVG
jgi:hypothetical protein